LHARGLPGLHLTQFPKGMPRADSAEAVDALSLAAASQGGMVAQ
jgi:hypothetical protein